MVSMTGPLSAAVPFIRFMNDYFYVDQARLGVPLSPALFSRCPNIDRAQEGDLYGDPNIIAKGKCLVLSKRTLDAGEAKCGDDEVFEKLTIEIPKPKVGKTLRSENGDFRVFYCKGACSWAPAFGDHYSTGCSGTVRLVSKDVPPETYRAQLDLRITCTYCRYGKTFKMKVPIKKTMTFRRLDHSQLNPWLGEPNDGWYIPANYREQLKATEIKRHKEERAQNKKRPPQRGAAAKP